MQGILTLEMLQDQLLDQDIAAPPVNKELTEAPAQQEVDTTVVSRGRHIVSAKRSARVHLYKFSPKSCIFA